jgi:hypothetical protein
MTEVKNLLEIIGEVCQDISANGKSRLYTNCQIIDACGVAIARMASGILGRHVYFERIGGSVRLFCYPEATGGEEGGYES